jgi:uncharacterized protein with HXXEE motif
MLAPSWLWWAPLGSAALHIGEEFVYPGGFAAWDREFRPSIRSSITPKLHVIVNALLLLGCFSIAISGMPGAALGVGAFRFRSAVPASLSVPCWLGMAALLFSNAVFHLVGSYRTQRWSPGVRTGVLLYLPMALYGYWTFLHTGQVSPMTAGFAALCGGSYHLWSAWAHRWRARRRQG